MNKISAIYPLTPLQEGILFHSLEEARSQLYIGQVVVRFGSGFNRQVFMDSWQRVIDCHDLLRTGFVWKDVRSPFQVVKGTVAHEWFCEDWSHRDERELQERLQQLIETDKQRGFDLLKPPLMRFYLLETAKDSAIWLWSHHHLIMDGWCMSLLIDDVLEQYQSLKKSTPIKQKAPLPFRSYVNWLSERKDESANTFWKEYLRDVALQPELRHVAHGDSPNEQRQRAELVFSPGEVDRIKEFVGANRTTIGIVALSAFAYLLSRLTGNDDIVFGTPISGRSVDFPGIDKMVGVFINTVPTRVHLGRDQYIADWLASIQFDQLNRERHGYLGLVDIAKASGMSRGGDLFNCLLAVENYPLNLADWETKAGIRIDSVETYDHTNYRFVAMIVTHGQITSSISYDPTVYDQCFIKDFLAYWQSIILQIADGASRISELNLVSARNNNVVPASSSSLEYDDYTPILEHIDKHAERTPEQTALRTTNRIITYETLSGEIKRLAGRFAGMPETRPVAVIGGPTINTAILLLSLLQAGRSFAVADRRYPAMSTITEQLNNEYYIFASSDFNDDVLANMKVCITAEPLALDKQGNVETITKDRRTSIRFYGVGIDYTVAIADVLVGAMDAANRNVFVPAERVLLDEPLDSTEFIRDLLVALEVGAEVALLSENTPSVSVNEQCQILRPTTLLAGSSTVEDHADLFVELGVERIIYRGIALSTETHERLSNAGTKIQYRVPTGESWIDLGYSQGRRARYSVEMTDGPLFCPSSRLVIHDENGMEVAESLVGQLSIRTASALYSDAATDKDNSVYHANVFAQLGIKPTEYRARRHSDGLVEIVDGRSPLIFRNQYVNVSWLCDKILATGIARDAYILVRRDHNGEERLAVFIVPYSRQFDARLESTIEKIAVFRHYATVVPVTNIPRKSDGSVDVDAIEKIPTINERLLSRISCITKNCEPPTLMGRRVHIRDIIVNRATRAKPSYEVSESIKYEETLGKSDQRDGASDHSLSLIEPRTIGMGEIAGESLLEALDKTVRRRGERNIIFIDRKGRESILSLAGMFKEAKEIAKGLWEEGIRAGRRALLQAEDTRTFVTAFWACQLLKVIPVPVSCPKQFVDDDAVICKMLNAYEILEDPILITDDLNKRKYQTLTELNISNRYQIYSVSEMRNCGTIERVPTQTTNEICLIILTSGSTGVPKAVPLTHHNVLYRTGASCKMNEFNENDVTLNWMPLDHVGGIVMCHIGDVVLGSTQVLVDTNYVLEDISRWLALASKYRATFTWAPNFAYALVNEYVENNPDQSWELSSLRFALNGGEAVVAKTVRRFLTLISAYGLPSSAVKPAFGMSEVSSATIYSSIFTLDSTSDTDSYTSVGQPIPGFNIRIVDDRDKIVSEGLIGRLQLKGPSVFSGYINNPEANRKSFTADGWFTSGDLAFVKDGNVTIAGREKDTIIINGVNYNGHEIESIVNEHSDVLTSYTAAFAVRGPNDDSDRLTLAITIEHGKKVQQSEIVESIQLKLHTTVGVRASYVVVLDKDGIPKTEIGKIKREILRQNFLNGMYDSQLVHNFGGIRSQGVLPNWFHRVKWRAETVVGHCIPSKPEPVILVGENERSLRIIEGILTSRNITVCDVVLRDRHRNWDWTNTTKPENVKYCKQLGDRLEEDGHVPRHIVFFADNAFRTGHEKEVPIREFRSEVAHEFVRLLQSLAVLDPSQAISVTFIGNRLFAVSESEELDPTYTMLIGITETANREFDNINVSMVDLGWLLEEEVANVIGEELYGYGRDSRIAYRNGKRHVMALEQLTADQSYDVNLGGSVIKPGGVYVITGGSGGIGTLLRTYLQEHFDAQVLVLSRHGCARVEENDVTSPLSSGAQTQYVAADITDCAKIADAFATFEQSAGKSIDAVFHLAGMFEEQPLRELNRSCLTSAVDAKVRGALNLGLLLRDRPGATLINFGSVNGLLGGVNVAAYSAANSGLVGASHYIRSEYGVPTRDLVWSMWDNIGMSRDYKHRDVTMRSGFHLLSSGRGLDSLVVALMMPYQVIYIGLDAAKGAGSIPLDGEPHPYYQVALDEDAAGNLPAIADDFGIFLRECDLVSGTSHAERDIEHPEDAVERGLEILWRETIGLDSVGVNENFFDIGGHSLNATRVISRINSYFRIDAPIGAMFEAPTIKNLAVLLRKMGPNDSHVDKVAALREQMDRMDRRQVANQLESRK